jgi:glycosyltransferase involved in cell wall biosynthesis
MPRNIDLSILIPTFNEEIHIGRSIENAKKLTSNVFVIDSFSTDKTVEIAEQMGAVIVQYQWEADSNWSKKFNWALENITFSTNWIMRLDADEYANDDFIAKITVMLPQLNDEVSAISVNRREYFMGRWMKHGGVYPKSMIRIIKKGKAFYEDRWLDEHVKVKEGVIEYLNIDLCDNRKISLTKWIDKHNSYSILEAIMLMDKEIGLFKSDDTASQLDKNSLRKRKRKDIYSKLPLFWRAWAFFIYRYFLKVAFLDGIEGFLYSFLQCLWYRMIADAKIKETYSVCGKDPVKILLYMKKEYGIDLSKKNIH